MGDVAPFQMYRPFCDVVVCPVKRQRPSSGSPDVGATPSIVAPGDAIVGDRDGVLVVPNAHLDEVVEAALAKVEAEEEVRRLIENGESTQAIFERTGIM